MRQSDSAATGARLAVPVDTHLEDAHFAQSRLADLLVLVGFLELFDGNDLAGLFVSAFHHDAVRSAQRHRKRKAGVQPTADASVGARIKARTYPSPTVPRFS